jgi:cellulose synthase/poly-beta-1,6-N-acetylglucosamine synthase-like glycosyltransferase
VQAAKETIAIAASAIVIFFILLNNYLYYGAKVIQQNEHASILQKKNKKVLNFILNDQGASLNLPQQNDQKRCNHWGWHRRHGLCCAPS